MTPRRSEAVVIDLVEFARVLRERGRIASLAGQKRAAFSLYRRAERYERLSRRGDDKLWLPWPLPERPSSMSSD